MKTFLSFLCICLLHFTIQAGGTEPSNIQLSTTSSNSLLLHIDEPIQEDTQLEILDRRGSILHAQQLYKGEKSGKLFQLAALPEGSYTIQLTNSLHIDRFPFVMQYDGVKLAKEDVSRQFRPVLVTKAGITNLSFLNEARQKVSVTLQDEEGQEVYTETLEAELQVTRRYNFRQLPQGNYQLVVKTGQDRVVHSLAL